MVSIAERYPKRGFLTADDVKDGDLTLQIAGVAWDENIGNGRTRDVVRFLNDGRELTLNATNAHRIARLHGDDGDGWRGGWVTLYFDPEVEYQGRKEGGIRVREQAPVRGVNGREKVPPAPAPPRDDPDDAIPF